jgi:hypothetical protein
MIINYIIAATFLLTGKSGFFLVSRMYCHEKWWGRGGCQEKHRQANGTVIQLYPVWKNENISRRTKGNSGSAIGR